MLTLKCYVTFKAKGNYEKREEHSEELTSLCNERTPTQRLLSSADAAAAACDANAE